MVFRNECRSDGTGTVHIVVGTAGAGLEAGGFSDTFGNYSVAHVDNWGYLRVFATETTLTTQARHWRPLHRRLMLLQFVLNDEDSVFDEVTLYPWPEAGRVDA